jgi:hypothetical protein
VKKISTSRQMTLMESWSRLLSPLQQNQHVATVFMACSHGFSRLYKV